MATRGGPKAEDRPIELPEYVRPMLARSTSEPFDSERHLFEIKWDGTRAVVLVDGRGMRLFNRRQADLRGRYPELEALHGLPAGTALDGEIVVLSGGKPSFAKLAQREQVSEPQRVALLSRRLPATLVVFDVLYASGKSVMARPLSERKPLLAELVRGLGSPHVIACDYVTERGRRYFEEVERIGLEGVMAKRLDSAYQPGKRTDDWLKIKVARLAELDVIGFTLQEGTRDTVGALLLGEKQGRGWQFRGKVGTGFTERQRLDLYRELSGLPALAAPPPGGPRDGVWRRCGKRCRVRYFEMTEHGMLRGPVFQGWTGDEKDP
ncbi:MAG: ATP-dependent DNA ligase [Phycisphaerae bacterium]|nr:ATP-dependent DNA ligase [Phycisphaerae bacterium]MCZ2400425.1 ATP-dependent DNA ligase [Phycisphaerae bacterium]